MLLAQPRSRARERARKRERERNIRRRSLLRSRPRPPPGMKGAGSGRRRPGGRSGTRKRDASGAIQWAREREWQRQRTCQCGGLRDQRAPGCEHQGRVLDQCRLTQLRRLRLDHGPQRQLLQVPQLRLHERLFLARRSFVDVAKDKTASQRKRASAPLRDFNRAWQEFTQTATALRDFLDTTSRQLAAFDVATEAAAARVDVVRHLDREQRAKLQLLISHYFSAPPRREGALKANPPKSPWTTTKAERKTDGQAVAALTSRRSCNSGLMPTQHWGLQCACLSLDIDRLRQERYGRQSEALRDLR